MSNVRLTRRHFLAGTAAATTLGFPGIVRGQPKEIVIGGAASHKAFMDPTVIPMFEKKYGCKIIFEGTKSLVNLEKMVSNKSKPYLSVVMMDDPVLLLAVKEDVLEKTTPAKVPNLAKLKPAAIHMDGMWTNYQLPYAGIAFAPAKVKPSPRRGARCGTRSTKARSSCRPCRTPRASRCSSSRRISRRGSP